MFSTFKILVIYLIIPSRCDNSLPRNGDKTILYLNERVQQEIAPFEDLLCEFKNAYAKGIILGKLEGILKRAIEVEMENEMHWRNEGRLKAQINDADKYRLALGLTHRIDIVESLLAPDANFKGKQRRVRWSTIFSLKTPAVEKFKKKVEDAGMTEVAFAECIETLCNERINRAGRARIPLPRIVDEKTIWDALTIMEIIDDKRFVETIKIVVAPLEGSDLTTTITPKKS